MADWIAWLEDEKQWASGRSAISDDQEFGPSGDFENGELDRKHWKSAAAIRKIFKAAFNYSPSSIRTVFATRSKS